MNQSDKQLFATRTNPSATRFGAIVRVSPPRGTSSVWRVAGEGSRGPLDLLAHVSRSSSDVGTHHTRVLPGLTLTAKPRRVSSGGKVVFDVTDAGAAVRGATVRIRIAGKTFKRRTNARGRTSSVAIADSTKRGRYTATATKSGYTKGSTRLRVRR